MPFDQHTRLLFDDPTNTQHRQRVKRDQRTVLGHDCDPLSVYGTQVCVLKQANKISLGSLLEGKDGGSFVAKCVIEILQDLTDKTVEGRLADE